MAVVEFDPVMCGKHEQLLSTLTESNRELVTLTRTMAADMASLAKSNGNGKGMLGLIKAVPWQVWILVVAPLYGESTYDLIMRVLKAIGD